MNRSAPLRLFQGYGVELEYMIVDAVTLDVRPIADELIYAAAGDYVEEVALGEIAWSNELALHVIELKNVAPAAALAPLAGAFQTHVTRINELLSAHGARLMPTAMHPWMDPARETRLWPHAQSAVYRAFDRVFGCRGHGWSNLQSVHLNLPFGDDAEFGRLHAAVRLLLPILPVLAASSPLVEARLTGFLDNRLRYYRDNQSRIPSITGDVIPEPVYTRGDYEHAILERIYRDIAPFDPERVLRHEWLNARGAIARFERNAIEVRVLDVQECPRADLAVAAAIAAALQALVAGRWADPGAQRDFAVAPLEAILRAVIADAEHALIRDRAYLAGLGFVGSRATAGELWAHLLETMRPEPAEHRLWAEPLRVIRDHGPLARRILRALGEDMSRARQHAVYRELCACLAGGRMFLGLD